MMTIAKLAAVAVGVGVLGGAGFVYRAFGAFLPWHEEQEATRLAGISEITRGSVVADIGAGTGRFSLAMARRVGPSGRVYSTELSGVAVAALDAAAAREGLRNLIALRAEALDTRLPDACCDVVFLRNVYHHVTDPVAFAGSLRAAVRDDGRLVIVDFDEGALWLHGDAPGDAPPRRAGHGVNRAAAIAEIEAAGFRLEREIADWSAPMWLLVFRPR